MSAHAHVSPKAVRSLMVVHPLGVFLGSLVFLVLAIVAASFGAVNAEPAALWSVLGGLGGLGSYGVWLFLLVRPLLRRQSEREFVRWRKGVDREQAVLFGITCPTCQHAGAVQRSASVGQFSCGRCGFTW